MSKKPKSRIDPEAGDTRATWRDDDHLMITEIRKLVGEEKRVKDMGCSP